jgi:hypothetical protein
MFPRHGQTEAAHRGPCPAAEAEARQKPAILRNQPLFRCSHARMQIIIQDNPPWEPGRNRWRLPILRWDRVEFAVQIQRSRRAAAQFPRPGPASIQLREEASGGGRTLVRLEAIWVRKENSPKTYSRIDLLARRSRPTATGATRRDDARARWERGEYESALILSGRIMSRLTPAATRLMRRRAD